MKYEQPSKGPIPTILDIGCGYGGLLFALSTLCPNDLIVGYEIRDTIAEFVGKKIWALRLS